MRGGEARGSAREARWSCEVREVRPARATLDEEAARAVVLIDARTHVGMAAADGALVVPAGDRWAHRSLGRGGGCVCVVRTPWTGAAWPGSWLGLVSPGGRERTSGRSGLGRREGVSSAATPSASRGGACRLT
eukprot:2893437-Prymnesium_polylepis.1